jgi:hypothetical protein
MDIIGVTRTRDGVEVDEFVIKCGTHEFFYKGQPPLTHGCSDCWLCYFFGQLVQSKGDIHMNVDQLEEAIRHAAELAEKGEWDFVPDFNVEFSKEN